MDKEYDVVDFMKDKEELENKIKSVKEEIDYRRQDLYNYETALQNLVNKFLFNNGDIKMNIERYRDE